MGWQEDQGAASQSQQLLTSCLNFLRWLICIVPRLWGDYRQAGPLVTCISHHAKTPNSHCAQPGAISTLLHLGSHLGLVCDELPKCLCMYSGGARGSDRNLLPGLKQLINSNSRHGIQARVPQVT